jgi:diguanylate cyclase (GGDEF)-like protein
MPNSSLLCDIDHFKKINDTYGHLVGDEVLRTVSSCLMSSVRSYDMVGRYGGEEFLLVIVGSSSSLAESRAEEIRSMIAGLAIETTSGTLSVTLSIGALTSSDWGSNLNATNLLNEADMALYGAKASGRNCLRIARPVAAQPAFG